MSRNHRFSQISLAPQDLPICENLCHLWFNLFEPMEQSHHRPFSLAFTNGWLADGAGWKRRSPYFQPIRKIRQIRVSTDKDAYPSAVLTKLVLFLLPLLS